MWMARLFQDMGNRQLWRAIRADRRHSRSLARRKVDPQSMRCFVLICWFRPFWASHFFLLAQKEVAKKKGTLFRRPPAAGSLRCSIASGRCATRIFTACSENAQTVLALSPLALCASWRLQRDPVNSYQITGSHTKLGSKWLANNQGLFSNPLGRRREAQGSNGNSASTV